MDPFYSDIIDREIFKMCSGYGTGNNQAGRILGDNLTTANPSIRTRTTSSAEVEGNHCREGGIIGMGNGDGKATGYWCKAIGTAKEYTGAGNAYIVIHAHYIIKKFVESAFGFPFGFSGYLGYLELLFVGAGLAVFFATGSN